MTPVGLEPAALRSRVKHSTTEPLRSLYLFGRIQQYEGLMYQQVLYQRDKVAINVTAIAFRNNRFPNFL